jgi:SSS family solute:Na+ symporter
MIVSLILVPLVSLMTPKMNTDHIEKTFACFEETVVVRKKRSIEE